MIENPEELKLRNDQLIDTWAPHERDNWSTAQDTDPLLVRLHRTALIALARVREAQEAVHQARILNAQYGNVAPGYEQYAPNVNISDGETQ